MGYYYDNDNDITNAGKSRFSAEPQAGRQNENFNVVNYRKTPPPPEKETEDRKERRNEKKSVPQKKKLVKKSVPAAKEKSGSAGNKNRKKTRNTGKGVSSGSKNENIRKSAKERKKVNRRENNLITAMLFLVPVCIIIILCFTVFFNIGDIIITNEGNYTDETVLQCAGIKKGDNLLRLNIKKIENKIETELPFIEDAQISKEWPTGLDVNIIYAVPSMAIDTGSSYVLLNSNGKVLDSSAHSLPQGTAVVEGLTVSSAVPGKTVEFDKEGTADDLIALSKSLAENEITGVSSYNLKHTADVRIMIGYRIELLLGTLNGADEKLKFGSEVVRRTIESDSQDSVLIDLKDKTKAYVRNKGDNNVNYNDDEILNEELTSEITENSGENNDFSENPELNVG